MHINMFFLSFIKSLEPLVRTLKDLSSDKTVVYCCFEERLTGNKPYLQKTFFEVCKFVIIIQPLTGK